jgi:hypothetical protein
MRRRGELKGGVQFVLTNTVTHGLMSRVFLMKWYHFSVEYFEDLRNVNHCEFLIMRKKEDSGKYILENNLRTWSELRRERLAALRIEQAAEKEKDNSNSPSSSNLKGAGRVSEKDKEKEKKLFEAAASPHQERRKWGGCPNGCDHSKHYYKKENSMHAMQLNGRPSPNTSPVVAPPESLPFRRPNPRRWQSSSDEDEDDPRGHADQKKIDVQKSLDEVVSSPDGTPSFISVEDRLRSQLKSPGNDHLLLLKHAGRDFGGSASGNTSQAGSDTEFSTEEDTRTRMAKGRKVGQGLPMIGLGGSEQPDRGPYAGGVRREESQMGRGAMADALGDHIDAGSEIEEEIDEMLRTEKEEKSVIGSVY